MWILPTRSRPQNCLRLINAWAASEASTPVYVRLDECDPFLSELIALPWPNNFIIKIGKREGVAKATNEIFVEYPHEDWYGFLADDFLPQTKKWDLILIEAAGTKCTSYPNDLGKKSKKDLPTLPCVGGDLVREIGWFGFPYTHHYFVDTVWKYIGEHLCNIKRLENVIVEHLHPVNGKSEIDIVYAESNAKLNADRKIYNSWVETEGKKLVARLKSRGF